MLASISELWNISKSRLYRHIKSKDNKNEGYELIFSSFFNALKNDKDNELEFLRENKDFIELLERYNN